MKIEISKDETYELKIPEKVNVKEFTEILEKLDGIAKIVRINVIAGTNFNEFKREFNHRAEVKIKSKAKNKITGFFRDRNSILDIMQYFYHGTPKDKERIASICQVKAIDIIKRFSKLVEKKNIKPQEVGLINFKQITPIYIPLTRIPNYTIKSYTGIFDEPEN